MLIRRQAIAPERFTFHSSRMRMRRVVKEELAAMDAESERCATELSDARVDVSDTPAWSQSSAWVRAITAYPSGGCVNRPSTTGRRPLS